MNDIISDAIQVRGARTHNLKNVDVDIPRNRLVVITGVSGSGKSSLAFDTLLAEGQRQYVQSLSVYARQFFEQMERPDVDRIEGLQPTIAIDQKPAAPNPRSTVATITEIYDYLRLLMARFGEVLCPDCGTPIAQQTLAEIEQTIRGLPADTKVMILAPMVRGRRGAHRDVLETIQKAGFVRVRIDGTTYPLDAVPPLAPQKTHDIEAVVDRIIIREGIDARLGESVRLAARHGDGVVLVLYQTRGEEGVAGVDRKRAPSDIASGGSAAPLPQVPSDDKWHERLLNTRYACPRCGTSIGEIEPRTFSFNSPYGACPACHGLGARSEERGANDGAGKAPPLELAPSSSLLAPCPDCGGSRLRPEARAVRLSGRAIHEITGLSVKGATEFFEQLAFHDDQRTAAEPIVAEIRRRLAFLDRVGTEYLTLDRAADTLSGGERQRVRLATGVGSGLVGVLYLLDEPSIGLHPRDNDRLIAALRDLQQQGNTVVVVEHDEVLMRTSDHLIDMGPGAGSGGGRIVAEGTPVAVAKAEASLTGAFLSGRETIALPQRRRIEDRGSRIDEQKSSRSSLLAPRSCLQLHGARANNLQNIDVDIPLHALVCVTGVSGSGKSSLVVDTLARALARKLHGAQSAAAPHRSLRGTNEIDRLVEVDQSPIGRSPRSNPATYTGVWNDIRRVFAGTKQSRQRGFGAARFSFNTKGGRCEGCQGQGVRRIAMNFLPDLEVTCPVCRGARFNAQTLSVRYRERSIADVLAMSIDQALEFFENHESVRRVLATLVDVGLGYLTLGQPSTTLSGGEAQRIKLATELGRGGTGHSLYILDEPTTGLHSDDIRRLLAVLNRLVDQGHSMIVIEHNLDVIKTADWVIDLGPEGGAGGGRVVVAGTPEQVAACAESHTGQFLRDVLAK
jgi:excinuclease ABC subunit A